MDIVVQMLNKVGTSENEHFTPVMDMCRIFGLVRKRGQCCGPKKSCDHLPRLNGGFKRIWPKLNKNMRNHGILR